MSREGNLYYDSDIARMDVEFDNGVIGGLHCGDFLDAKIGDEWVPTRIEHSDDFGWYLVGIKDTFLPGLLVRI